MASSIDDIVQSLSCLDIKEGLPWKSALEADLTEARTWITLREDDPRLLALAKIFCKRWHIPEQAALNFTTLTSGQTKFPVIMLQNPTSDHHFEKFDNMIQKSPTLAWLQNVFHSLGLTIRDVIILDVCPLVSDQWIKKLKRDDLDRAGMAVREAYFLTSQVLDIIRPRIILCCQCATKVFLQVEPSIFAYNATDLAESLGSSVKGAKDNVVKTIEHSGRDIFAIQGFHPRYFMIRRDEGRSDDGAEELLRSRLREVLLPCSQWKKKNDELLALTRARLSELIAECSSRQLQIDRMLEQMNVLERRLSRSHETGETKSALSLKGVKDLAGGIQKPQGDLIQHSKAVKGLLS
jgi:hypothetical protein